MKKRNPDRPWAERARSRLQELFEEASRILTEAEFRRWFFRGVDELPLQILSDLADGNVPPPKLYDRLSTFDEAVHKKRGRLELEDVPSEARYTGSGLAHNIYRAAVAAVASEGLEARRFTRWEPSHFGGGPDTNPDEVIEKFAVRVYWIDPLTFFAWALEAIPQLLDDVFAELAKEILLKERLTYSVPSSQKP